MESSAPNLYNQVSQWIRDSIMIKLASIGFMIIVLMLPSAWIMSLMEERQNRANEVMSEVAGKWSGEQTLAGPVLVIPFNRIEKIDKGKDGSEFRKVVDRAYFLPDQLSINGDLSPQILHRGIFESVVYDSKVELNATFVAPDFTALRIAPEDVIWQDAHMTLGISDLRGIAEQPSVLVGNLPKASEPANQGALWVEEQESAYDDSSTETTGSISIKLDWKDAAAFVPDVQVKLSLRGSQQLMFVPMGKTTEVRASGAWADPGFDGEFLPVSRSVGGDKFEAQWKVLHFNRPFSQQWIEDGRVMRGNQFGVRLLLPVEQYQKSIRTSKYGILLIMLTFISLFMVEIIRKVRIHPFQYILIGAAVVIYYLLLLALSEQIGFNWSYGVSCLATVVLIILYSSTFIGDRKVLAMLTAILAVFYTFIFTIIQLQDYALMLGSIGLFITLGLLMYFSRKVQWYSAAGQ